jgi:hypothetical protein
MRLVPGWRGGAIAAGVAMLVTLLVFGANASVYFGTDDESYLGSYRTSSLPYSEIGNALRSFADSGGSFANAFMVAYPYWWDHRAIGIEAGLLDWPNGIVSRDQILSFMYESSQRIDQYRFDPDKDILFFVSPDDLETQALLRQLFPNAYEQIIVHVPSAAAWTGSVRAPDGDAAYRCGLMPQFFEECLIQACIIQGAPCQTSFAGTLDAR